MNLETVYMSEKTKKHLMDKGYKKLTDVQLKVIPCATEGRDIIAQSQTGTGKTAAFLIPIIEKLGNNYENRKKPRALIMVPTRELAIQVGEEAKKLCIDSRIRVLSIFGGERIGDQLKKIRKGLDIVIGTPGRIMDHLFKKKSLNIKELLFFVLDEVDEMISQGFLEDIEEIIKETPEEKQTFLFSATMPDQVEIFAKKWLNNPKRIAVESNETNQLKISHYFLETLNSLKKDNALEDFVKNNRDGGPTIIFANTKRKVEEIYNKLSDRNLKADYIHSDLSQSRRTRVFNKFRDRRISFLIATDVAARGLDIKGVSYVINYDFPQTDEFYIHRVGRTGRAGMVGKAITYINSIKEKKSLFSISEKKNFELMNADPEGREIIDHKREISGKKDRDSWKNNRSFPSWRKRNFSKKRKGKFQRFD